MIEIELGMPADEVLTLPGYTKRDAIKATKQVGKVLYGYGLVVRWFYADKTLTMKWSDGCYRVAEIEEVR